MGGMNNYDHNKGQGSYVNMLKITALRLATAEGQDSRSYETKLSARTSFDITPDKPDTSPSPALVIPTHSCTSNTPGTSPQVSDSFIEISL